ncbi:trehalose-6-phosphate synthase [Halorubellus sp. JP-L1]|uniref:alpha,alpha-trehalose-phosphate synthase (UDP-forming) n=1 Tax=Halorubellus sp. JP-L1 TaxID=2715753 RepID=UPI00140BFD26|nr:trehalose-6-phosphate synthase [Halorubellus sp. JP-L1]NHN42694.1 trehalose-6-phosphate synthase [Halorubellus sp. JP-L1]
MQQDTPNGNATATDEFGDDDARSVLAGRDLVVVSNRQPYAHNYDDGEVVVDAATGGLTSGLDPFLRESGGTWVAWGDGDADREVVDADDRVRVPPEDPAYDLRRVWLDDDDVEGYYYGFSNRVLWPICHGFLGNVHSEPSYWQRYRDVNERFADVVADDLGAGDDPIVWFQDYHLALAPRMVRRAAPDGAGLLQFWHIPWPTWDTFRACPHGRAILRGLLGNDVLGFHVERYSRNFLECVDRALEDAAVDYDRGLVEYDGEATDVVECPLGIEVDRVEDGAEEGEAAGVWESFAAEHGIREDATIALGVERLDYTKGIPERLRALETVWETEPEWRGELTYVQNASESRSRIPEYAAVQETVESEIARINDRFGTEDWTPIVYTTDRLSPAELYGLYRRADVGIVSAVRDGLNLVAPEYVAAQDRAEPGVLVLSDQTGVHDRLGRSALSVSPLDCSGFAATITVALNMSLKDRRRRHALLRDDVVSDSLSEWVRTFAAAVARTEPALPAVTDGGR